MRILRARLLAAAQEAADAAASDARRSQVRTVDRSERIRTYNFPRTGSRTTASATRRTTSTRCSTATSTRWCVAMDADLAARRPAMPDSVAAVQPALWGLVGDAADRLERAGVPSPRYDAEVLAAFALGVRRSQLRSVDHLDDDALARFAGAGRAARAPRPAAAHPRVAPFRHVELAVGPGVFVPRPETEVVAGWAIDGPARSADAGRVPLVVDLCTGSGAIALSLADEVPGARVHAVELDPRRRWSGPRRNLDGTAVTLHAGDAADAFPELDGHRRRGRLQPAVHPGRRGRPRPRGARARPGARAVGPARTGSTSSVSSRVRAAALLRPGGLFVVEHADVQGASVPAVLVGQGGWARSSTTRTSPAATGSAPPAARACRRTRSADPGRRGDEPPVRLRRPRRAAPRARAGRRRRRARRARRAADRHRLRHRAPTRSAGGRRALLAAKGRGRDMPVPVLVGSPRTLDGLTFAPADGRARARRGVLAGRADRRGPPGAVAGLGPRRHRRHRRRADAAAPGGDRAAVRRSDRWRSARPTGPASRPPRLRRGDRAARRRRCRSTSTAGRAASRCPRRSST